MLRKHRGNSVSYFELKAKRRAGSAAGGVQADFGRSWPKRCWAAFGSRPKQCAPVEP
jgi:hypothetical protein